MTPQEFGQAIREERQHRGWTQGQLASRIGCKTCMVTAWELGRRTPKVRDIWDLGRLFDSHRFDTAIERFLTQGRRGVLPEIQGGYLGSYVAIRAQAEEMLADVASVQSTVCQPPERWGDETVRLLKMNALDLIRTATRMLIDLEALFGGSASEDARNHVEWMRREGYLETKIGRPGASRAA